MSGSPKHSRWRAFYCFLELLKDFEPIQDLVPSRNRMGRHSREKAQEELDSKVAINPSSA
jgi:hypothetical protein